MSSAKHPETDGQTDWMNNLIINVDDDQHHVNPPHDDWDEHVTAIVSAINNAFQQSIETTPCKLAYGQTPLTPATWKHPQ